MSFFCKREGRITERIGRKGKKGRVRTKGEGKRGESVGRYSQT
jgi:hypothetical protein